MPALPWHLAPHCTRSRPTVRGRPIADAPGDGGLGGASMTASRKWLPSRQATTREHIVPARKLSASQRFGDARIELMHPSGTPASLAAVDPFYIDVRHDRFAAAFVQFTSKISPGSTFCGPQGHRKTCFIRHDSGLRRCLVPVTTSLMVACAATPRPEVACRRRRLS